MHLANSTTARIKKITLFIFAILTYTFGFSQENSPYSRYGIGDLVPNQNMVSRSMGGIAAGFIDSTGTYIRYSQSINLANPASLGSLNTTMFDIGGEIDVRTLRSNISPAKYTATSTIISYLQLGFPITPKRMLAKNNFWGVSFGLRPMTRVNYKISADKRLTGIDSITTLYEGNGGLNQANISTGVKIKNFSFGASTGYSFGNRQTGTKIGFNNDSVKYQQSNTQVDSRFGGVFLDLGLQYSFNIYKTDPSTGRTKHTGTFRIGFDANLQQNLKGKRNNVNETFLYGTSGSVIAIDTVTSVKDEKGTVKLPATYSGGFTYTNAHWLFGADVDFTQWSQYRYFGAADAVQNNVTVHMGAQYCGAKENTLATKYWTFVKYRAGMYFGNDYVKLNTTRPDFGLTLGAGLPITSFQRLRQGDFSVVNLGFELGQHGNKQNTSLRETVMRFNFGFSLPAAWFQKRKYD